ISQHGINHNTKIASALPPRGKSQRGVTVGAVISRMIDGHRYVALGGERRAARAVRNDDHWKSSGKFRRCGSRSGSKSEVRILGGLSKDEKLAHARDVYGMLDRRWRGGIPDRGQQRVGLRATPVVRLVRRRELPERASDLKLRCRASAHFCG